ncbi:hypothetical protein L2E82_13852 [Cichorium intybus]|uniref:Uncharacterized protein n=1 Tax=Cichorium intybus TaxID=13427 RepID=A0ACB9EXT1_CICIN|nr:hypothetical protein L2E82_13852 [Cichorium intybus]
MSEDDCADTSIPLPNVTSKILLKVIEYCKKHVETPKTDDKTAEEDLKSFDSEFVKVDPETLFDLILKWEINASLLPIHEEDACMILNKCFGGFSVYEGLRAKYTEDKH